jgi:AraC-like DNA-binding protein
MQLHNFITVDNPNIPVLSHTKPAHIEYGKFIENTVSENDWPEGLATLRVRDMYLPNFSLREIDAQFLENAMFYNTHAHGSELLGSCIFFKARLKSVLPGEDNGVDIYNRTHNFKYDPDNDFLHLAPANTPLHFVHFSYTSEYLNQFLPENEVWAERLRERILTRQRLMGGHSLPLSVVQENALQNIFNCPLEGRLGEMMMETSIIQLLLLQLHGLFGKEANILTSKFGKRDLEVAQELKIHLSETFLHDHTLSDLSRQFGVKTNKLMTLFKSLFDKSIFEYLNDLRMEFARNQIRESDKRIIDIARMIGYKNPNHFSAAFKKHFGISPTALR